MGQSKGDDTACDFDRALPATSVCTEKGSRAFWRPDLQVQLACCMLQLACCMLLRVSYTRVLHARLTRVSYSRVFLSAGLG